MNFSAITYHRKHRSATAIRLNSGLSPGIPAGGRRVPAGFARHGCTVAGPEAWRTVFRTAVPRLVHRRDAPADQPHRESGADSVPGCFAVRNCRVPGPVGAGPASLPGLRQAPAPARCEERRTDRRNPAVPGDFNLSL